MNNQFVERKSTMIRRILPTVICIVTFFANASYAEENDSIRAELETAKATYDAQFAKYLGEVEAWFTNEDQKARDLSRPADRPAAVK